jgi:acetyltransferase-like isoleucine patch superfamily enzyme
MIATQLIRKAMFRARERWATVLLGTIRKLYWMTQGMLIGESTVVPKIFVTWPHQVSLGRRCRVEHGVYFHYDGIYSQGPNIIIGDNCFIGANIEFNISSSLIIGNDCLIASGTVFVDHNHGTSRGVPMRRQDGQSLPITVGDDVWIGANCVILAGVTLGAGSVIGAGSIVTKSTAPNTIAVGVPARAIKKRSLGHANDEDSIKS